MNIHELTFKEDYISDYVDVDIIKTIDKHLRDYGVIHSYALNLIRIAQLSIYTYGVEDVDILFFRLFLYNGEG